MTLNDAKLEEIRRRLRELGGTYPWSAYESDLVWVLEARDHPHQILKAPKKGTTYAEYWPNAAEGLFIVSAPEYVELLLTEVDYLRKTIALIREKFPATGRHRRVSQ